MSNTISLAWQRSSDYDQLIILVDGEEHATLECDNGSFLFTHVGSGVYTIALYGMRVGVDTTSKFFEYTLGQLTWTPTPTQTVAGFRIYAYAAGESPPAANDWTASNSAGYGISFAEIILSGDVPENDAVSYYNLTVAAYDGDLNVSPQATLGTFSWNDSTSRDFPVPISSTIPWPAFDTEYSAYEYNPYFSINSISIGEHDTPYVRTENREIWASTATLQILVDYEWTTIDLVDVIQTEIPTFSDQVRVGPNAEERVAFDDDGGIYVIVENETDTKLLYTTDVDGSWQVLSIPYYHVRIEFRDGHNDTSEPPVLLAFNDWGSTTIYLYIPTLSGGVLSLNSPILVASGVWAPSVQAGASNQTITKSGYTHVVYADATTYGEEEGARQYAKTCTRSTRALSSATLIGNSGTGDSDAHDMPALTIDSSGYLHAVMGGHHTACKYAVSSSPDSTSAWSSPIEIGTTPPTYEHPYYTYPALVCDKDDALHLIVRGVSYGWTWDLRYLKKVSGQSWGADSLLVRAGRTYYANWYHKLCISSVRGGVQRLYLSFIYIPNQMTLAEIAAYEARWGEDVTADSPSSGDRWNVSGVYAHDPGALVSLDGGASWQLLTTQDFIDAMAPTNVVCTVDPDGSGDFLDVAAAITGVFGSSGTHLVNNDEKVICRLTSSAGSPHTTTAVLNGFTTDATRNITFIVPPEYRLDGRYPASGNYFRWETTGNVYPFSISDANVIIIGVPFKHSPTSDHYSILTISDDAVVVEECVFGVNSSAIVQAVNVTGANVTTCTIRNCLAYPISGSALRGFRLSQAGATLNLQNCTVIDGAIGVYQTAGTLTPVNCVIDGAGTPFLGTMTSANYNAYSSGSDPGTNGIDISGYTPSQLYVDPDNDDYHLLLDTSSPLIEAGINLYSSGVVTDIDGQARPSSGPFDIGADRATRGGDYRDVAGAISRTRLLAGHVDRTRLVAGHIVRVREIAGHITK